MPPQRHAHLIGSGIGSLAAAAFMIHDGGLAGDAITIFETQTVPGGSPDGSGTAESRCSMRGGRMLTTDNYECTWEPCKTIPSLTDPAFTVHDETVAFNTPLTAHSQARLIDKNRAIVDVTTMGF